MRTENRLVFVRHPQRSEAFAFVWRVSAITIDGSMSADVIHAYSTNGRQYDGAAILCETR